MASYIFEHDGNRGLLKLTTHNGINVIVECHKDSNQIFKIGGTAVDSVLVFPSTIISIDRGYATVQSIKSSSMLFSGPIYTPGAKVGDLAFAIEYYDIYMEGKPPSWLISPLPIEQANILFINVECLDAGGNLIRRYRVSPFTGECRMMEFVNGTQ